MKTSISAYLLRWGHVSQSTDGQTVRSSPRYLQDWLARNPAFVPIIVNHGTDPADRDRQVPELGAPAGRWERFESDEIGLLGHGYLDDSPLGLATAKEIRDRRLTACSYHGTIGATEPTGTIRDGAEVFDMLDGVVVEGGPCTDPADPGAVIVELDGRHLRDAEPVGGAMALLETFTGESFDEVGARLDREREAKGDEAEERVDQIETLARRVARVQRKASIEWGSVRAGWGTRDARALGLAYDQEAADLWEALTELVTHDQEILASLRDRYGVTRPVTPLGRLKSMAG